MNRLTIRFTAKDTAERLGFTTTNLKHYASLLEQNGHSLFRNTRNHREYSQHDINLLMAMKILNKDKSMLLDEAASLVMSEDTDIQSILNLNEKRIDANIRVVAQDNDNDVRELSLINAFQIQLNKRDQEYMQLLAAINEKLHEQLEENKQLKNEISLVRSELEKLSTPKAEISFRQKLFKSKNI